MRVPDCADRAFGSVARVSGMLGSVTGIVICSSSALKADGALEFYLVQIRTF